jgi:branched-chain amino acid transport system permease protein
LGIYIVAQNVLSILCGDRFRTLSPVTEEVGIDLLGARITHVQALIVCLNILLYVVLASALRYSKIGRLVRAVSNDPELAMIFGINQRATIVLVFGVGSALAAVAGILISADTNFYPTMGFDALLMGVVAAIIGGVGSLPGALVGGLLLGVAEAVAGWKLPSYWQYTIAFILLIAFLLVRPQGIFGKEARGAAD